tara:strand:+ start:338 stop:814 length:477 start_codon:yes stop_codon:yes gene_type:complete
MTEPGDTPDILDTEPEEEMLCPHCLRPTDPISHFCNHCAGPTSMHSSIDPMGQVYSMGHAYRNSTDRPTKFVTVLGIWLIFSPLMVPLLFVIITIPWTWLRYGEGDFNSIYALIFGLGLGSLYGLIIYKTTRSYLKHKQQQTDITNGNTQSPRESSNL